jgi:exopolyphosphatase / guanosine-5'-triphosphate,3'-diphosphate pyrophosphatase
MKTELRASIDIGSNSVLLLIADVTNNKLTEISKRSFITSLGKDLDKNMAFHPESMKSTYDAIKDYAEECDKHNIPRESIIATATEASRVAQNSAEFFDKIKNELNVNIQTITSQAEAYFSTKGILFNSKFNSEVITIMDIGGASTELIKVNTKTFNILEVISLPVGAVRASQWLDDDLFVQKLQKILIDFRGEIDKFQSQELFCVAGTVTSLGNMHLQHKDFVEDDVHGLVLKAEDIDILFKKYSDFKPAGFLELFPFLQKRSNSIKGGLHLVYHLIHRLLVKEITISTYGLRFGTILEGKIKKDFLHVR